MKKKKIGYASDQKAIPFYGNERERKMKELKELKERIENIEISYNYEETHTELKNAVIDYMNDTQDWDFEAIGADIIDYELAEEQAKYELENGGLVRLYYFLGNANVNNALFKVNGYGNLEDLELADLENMKEELLAAINEKLEEVTE